MPRARRGLAAIGGWVLALGIAGVTTPARCGTITITIEDMQFSPAAVTVKRGDQVVWINKDLVPHTATAPGGFDSGTVPAGKSWRMIATRRGRHEYTCAFHPTMKGVLVVE